MPALFYNRGRHLNPLQGSLRFLFVFIAFSTNLRKQEAGSKRVALTASMPEMCIAVVYPLAISYPPPCSTRFNLNAHVNIDRVLNSFLWKIFANKPRSFYDRGETPRDSSRLPHLQRDAQRPLETEWQEENGSSCRTPLPRSNR